MYSQSLSLIIIFIALICGEEVTEQVNSVNISRLYKSNPHWVPSNGRLVPDGGSDVMLEQKKCGEGPMKGIQICVHYNRCDPITKEIIPETVTRMRGLSLFPIGTECPELLDICCTIPEKDRTTTTSSTTTELTPTKPTPPIPTFKPTTLKPTRPKPTQLQLSYCGIRNPNGLNTPNVGNDSDEARYGEFPWVVMIFKTDYDSNESRSICGGSLISPAVILTAAHCVQNYVNNLDKIKVRAGEWDILSEQESYPKQDRGVSQIIIHANYNQNSGENNFALIFLETPYTRAENIGTICLPLYRQVIYSKNCFTGGWGKENAHSSYSNILKKIELPIVSCDICQKELRKTELGPSFVLPDTMICAGEYGKDTCTGDAGGPLVCPDPYNPKRYVQVGIVAWGVGCFEAPGVYSDVASARHWIDAVMADKGYNPIPYS
nr:serine protease 28-like [Onthophagus taurus]